MEETTNTPRQLAYAAEAEMCGDLLRCRGTSPAILPGKSQIKSVVLKITRVTTVYEWINISIKWALINFDIIARTCHNCSLSKLHKLNLCGLANSPQNCSASIRFKQ